MTHPRAFAWTSESIPWGDTAPDGTKYALLEDWHTAQQCMTPGVEPRLCHPRVQVLAQVTP